MATWATIPRTTRLPTPSEMAGLERQRKAERNHEALMDCVLRIASLSLEGSTEPAISKLKQHLGGLDTDSLLGIARMLPAPTKTARKKYMKRKQ